MKKIPKTYYIGNKKVTQAEFKAKLESNEYTEIVLRKRSFDLPLYNPPEVKPMTPEQLKRAKEYVENYRK
jgi:formylglycine-generating enzyme required for sulfatase activity